MKEQLKMDIVNWFKENIIPELDKKAKINTNLLKDIEVIIKHEYLHCKFYSIVNLDTELWIYLEKGYDELGLIVKTNGSCKLINNKRYFFPQYYFHLVVSEIAHLIYDIIFDILNFNFFKNFLFRFKRFLKNSIGNLEYKEIYIRKKSG